MGRKKVGAGGWEAGGWGRGMRRSRAGSGDGKKEGQAGGCEEGGLGGGRGEKKKGGVEGKEEGRQDPSPINFVYTTIMSNPAIFNSCII